MVKFIINESLEDLKEEDASLCYGYFELDNFILFDANNCLLLIAIVEFYEKLIELETKEQTLWVVSDNAETVYLEKQEDVLRISYHKSHKDFDYSFFKGEFLKEVSSIINYLTSVNNNIVTESAFIDLNNLLV